MSSHVDDFNTRNKVFTAKLLKQGYRYHKLRKAFSKFYRRHFDLVSKYNVGLKTIFLQGLSEPEFSGDFYGKQLFTWLSLVVSFMASFVLSFFPLDVLDGIWDLIESVSEGFLT